jgi:two-component system, OmpR family, phosphate regulon sensor histidine kinase PhoR
VSKLLRFSSIRWRTTAPYILIVLVTTLGLTLYLSTEVRRARLADLRAHLVNEAVLLADQLRDEAAEVSRAEPRVWDARVAHWSELLGQRVTLIDANGLVLAESHAEAGEMDNHLNRPEIREARRDGTGTAMRFSETLNAEVMYAAAVIRGPSALTGASEIAGYVRVALPLGEVQAAVDQLSRTLLISGFVVTVAAAILATYVSSLTIRPLRQLTATVERVAAGDLSDRLLPTTHDEVGQLTRAFNHMADQLQEKVVTLASEQARLSTVLEIMGDGVIITDESGVVVMANAAAARILRYDLSKIVGRRFSQVAYSRRLVELWNRCYEAGEPQNETIETALYGNFLQAVMTPLQAAVSPRILVMLQDLTNVRRLETVRRDFISNISHELRTPLASLSLVVETLRDGAIEDPSAAQRFLTHMENELASLTQLVGELLELSRIESGRVPLEIVPTEVGHLIRQPVERLHPQAERAGVELTLSVPDGLPKVSADAQRIHQVLTNLVHNAIKFTAAGGRVSVFARPASREAPITEVIIGVADTGIGIPEEDLPRIFERFYKTDRARTQAGTGLGLAISKHIVQGHGGRIWAESLMGVGSTFYFALPAAQYEPDL